MGVTSVCARLVPPVAAHSPSRPPFTRLSCLNPPRFGYNDPLMVRYAKGEPRARAAQS